MVAKGKLSFAADDDDDDEPTLSDPTSQPPATSSNRTTSSSSPRRLGPNHSLPTPPPLALTKSSLSTLATQRETLRQEFLRRQALIRASPIALPFVFHDGTDTPGGTIRMKKGDQVWLFLDKARKAGAELGVGGDRGLREWARVGVDDLMMVRGGVVMPHVWTSFCDG